MLTTDTKTNNTQTIIVEIVVTTDKDLIQGKKMDTVMIRET